MLRDIFEKSLLFIKNNLFIIMWVSVILVITVGIFIPDIIKYSESPEFCVKCHSMKDQYDTWTHSLHRNFKCVDCHLPNDNIANHYIWKAVDGTKDLISETLGLKEWWEIHLSEHGKKVLQGNCVRCHEGIITHINKNKNCIDCHRNVSHKNTAASCSFNTESKN